MEIFQFESFVLDRNAYELRRDGEVVRLERMPMELLFLLVERRGQLVTRQDILDRLYGREVVGDVDNSINTAIRKIRQALQDRTDEPRFLHTIPGKGYRFSPPVVELPTATPTPDVTADPAPLINPPNNYFRHRWFWISLPLVVVVSAALLIGYSIRERAVNARLDKVMLVVLPFQNLSRNPQQEYFADGMTEEMIAQLGSLDPQHLGVIARTSAMLYKGANKDLSQIAKELGVKYLLESSVRLDNDRVRVTAKLIQASDQTNLWADSFDRDLGDTLKIQSDVARGIAGKIGLTLSQQTQQSLSGTPIVNPEAHQAFLLGLQFWNLRTRDGVEQSISELNRAIAIDPNYATAYATLARTYVLAPVFGVSTHSIAMPKAREMALKALVLDSTQAEAHSALGFVSAHYDHDWKTAEREFRLGLALNPSDALGHLFYSNSYLSPLNRHEEAIAEAKRAAELDPFAMPIHSFLGRTYVAARRYDEGLAQYLKVARIAPGLGINHERLAHLYAFLGKFEESITAESTARTLFGEDPQAVSVWAATLRKAVAAQGARGYWQALLQLSSTTPYSPESYSNSFGLAIIYAQLGEKDKAFASMEKAYDEHWLEMSGMDNQRGFDNLRDEPRFQAMRKRMGLAQQ